MLSSRNISAEMGAHYYRQENYYSAEEASFQSQWWGKAAACLGLSGQIDPETFTHLLHGTLANGECFRQRRATHRDYQDRAALDLTFSAPKSVSIAALVCRDAGLVEAHQQACRSVLQTVETDYAETRIRKDGKRIKVRTNNLVVAQFHHDTSRELDPQLHTHCVVLNMTLANDKWYSLSNGRLFKHKKRLGQRYQRELAQRVEALGYEIVWKDHGMFELAGFTPEQLQAFSKRKRQIESVARTKGGWRARQIANLQTRQPKIFSYPVELVTLWQQVASDVSIGITDRKHPVADYHSYGNGNIPTDPTTEISKGERNRYRV